jgi:DNA-binding Lrp family transcriptional regulator
VDELDLRILAATGFALWGYQAAGFEALSTSTIAEQVDRSPETVRRRLRDMEQDGVIRGYQVSPSFRHLGLAGEALQLELDDEPPLEDLELVDGVAAASDFVGPPLLVLLGYRGSTERDRRVHHVTETLGAEDPTTIARLERRAPERELTDLDWRIVRALRGDAKRGPGEVADEVGVTARTVRRRRQRMVDDGALHVAPVVAVEEITGAVPFNLVARHAPDQRAEARNRLTKRFEDRVLGVPERWPMTGRRVVLFLHASSIAEVDRLRAQAEEVAGVEAATTLIPKRTLRTGWIDALVEAQLGDPDA